MAELVLQNFGTRSKCVVLLSHCDIKYAHVQLSDPPLFAGHVEQQPELCLRPRGQGSNVPKTILLVVSCFQL